ncbi:MAG: UPF0182 family protein, partial [Steroidobacteraceae bacterium]
AIAIAAEVGSSMAGSWSTLALWWSAPQGPAQLDPIFGLPLRFYLFSLPAWQLLTGWLLTLAVIVCVVAAAFAGLASGARALAMRGVAADSGRAWRGFAIAGAALLIIIAARVYLGRFDRLFDDHSVFSGVDYTDAHITLTGLLVVCAALVVGAGIAVACAIVRPRPAWILTAVVPGIACYIAVQLIAAYVSTFVVKPNQLDRERPYIVHNIALTRRGFALDRIKVHPFPADTGVSSIDPSQHRTTLDNIRLWDWRPLQDSLKQIQEIRTYYDFPDIDIDRYRVGGKLEEMMLAVRGLNVEKLPVSSQTWVNEKLIYTHGYGITMNTVNGFTQEGLPNLLMSDMPVVSTVPGLKVTRPQIYFGQLTKTDVYVKTRQKEFNYPQGETNNFSTYEGSGGIRLGGLLRRALIAYDVGDIAKLPFSDAVTANSRLLMRRNIRARVQALAPFLTYDPDPYIVVSRDGRLYWIMDAYTTSDSYPYSRRYLLGEQSINYIRNSVKIVIDAYTGATTFYVFDPQDPIIEAYRKIFPSLFKDEAQMPADLRAHVRYPELYLSAQASVYGLYHMTDPEVFYNREDLWSIATQGGAQGEGQEMMEPNYVLMTLPGDNQAQFVNILPFTPANRNNLIGWIGGLCDGAQYGKAVVYDFPKSKLVDGPLQVEARINQNAEISGQLSLWNQLGSRVRRGALIVIPIDKALLYAQPIYLQAENSPMPELRLVVLALQDRLAYGPTFETAMAALFNGAPSMLNSQSGSGQARAGSAASSRAAASSGPGEGSGATQGAGSGTSAAPVGAVAVRRAQAQGRKALIDQAARDFADYEQLTAAGKLGAAGQKLESLKSALQELQGQRH